MRAARFGAMLDVLCHHGPCIAELAAARLLNAAFLAVLFLQSGLDKVLDRKGNLAWLSEHFAKSPLAPFVGAMLTTITIFELSAGLCSALGAAALVLTGSTGLALAGALLSALSLLMLFFGQRMAKDYAGAAVLVPYFLLSIVAICLFGLPISPS